MFWSLGTRGTCVHVGSDKDVKIVVFLVHLGFKIVVGTIYIFSITKFVFFLIFSELNNNVDTIIHDS